MKFSNGGWLQRKGVAAFSPVQVFESEVFPDRVRFVAATHPILDKGATLQDAALFFEITAPCEGAIRVRAVHHEGRRDPGPRFELPGGVASAEISETPDAIVFRSGSLALRIERKPWRLVFLRASAGSGNGRPPGGREEVLCESAPGDLAYLRTDWTDFAYARDDGSDAFFRERLSVAVGECFYGLGERFGAFVRNGQSVDLWNEDGGTCSDQAYKNVPLLVSSRGWGLFANDPGRVSWEVCSERVDRVQFSVPGERLDYVVFDGPTPRGVLRRYALLLGHPALPPPWTFGLWLSTSFLTDYDEKTVLSFVDGMRERGIPLSVFHFDCCWMKPFHWTDFLWDPATFPDPRGLLRKLHDRGLKVCVWINPYVAQASALFDEGLAKGFFLHRKNGDVWQWDLWQPGLAIVDFTNPDAKKWYQEKLAALLDQGVDCVKTDFGERIPLDAAWADGSDPAKMHNYYTQLYNGAVFELLEKKRGRGEAVVFARSATAGGQRFPVHWGGDCFATYAGMEQTIRGGLSLAMAGFGFWSHDISGFENTATPDLYKRWSAFGLLSSHSRLHGSNSYRVPWNFDEESVDVLRAFTRLKMRLVPYLWRAALQAHAEGLPVLRPMVLEHADDPACLHLERQYFLGDDLLVAPVFDPEGIGEFYVPAAHAESAKSESGEGRALPGPWTDWFTGERFEPGRFYRRKVPYDRVPLLVRTGAVVPVGAHDDGPEYDWADGATFRVFGPRHGARGEIFGRDGALLAALDVAEIPGGFEFRFSGKEPAGGLRIALANIEPAAVEGATLSREGFFAVLSDCAPVVRVQL
ncbi:MAG: alpha-xylosidase [Kiritimatiellae bacterium]|nr:alpha-xylosidase [Kiritimatiellia bacterium]